jgi:microcystin degradation protein MlrC
MSTPKMPKLLRVAFGRINQETNALSPVLTELSDFAAVHLIEDSDELLRRCRFFATEVEGMFRNAELSGFVRGLEKQAQRRAVNVEAIPLLSAWAVPSGPLTQACFDALTAKLCASLLHALDDGPLDAVYLSLHGAMNVEGFDGGARETPESEIVRRVRDVVGDIPIAVSLDLHGNVTTGLVERCTILQGYQTNPHRDHAAVGARCAALLVDTVLGHIAPAIVWRSLPMLLGGGNTVDFLAPMRRVFRHMHAVEKRDGIVAATVMTVHPWNRHRELGWSVLVVVNTLVAGALARAEMAADELADACWQVRHQLPPTLATPQQAIERARRKRLARALGVIVFSDASDVVSAGAPGENTALLSAVLAAPDLITYATVRDVQVVKALHAEHRVGDIVDVTIGGKLDTQRGQPLSLHARIDTIGSAFGVGRLVVLSAGGLRLVVVEGPAMAVKPSYYKQAGLDPWKADVIVVKNFFPFLLFFAPLLRDVVFVKTAGVTDFDAAFGLEFTDPMHPRDVVDDWRRTDQRRRGLAA